MRKKVFEGQKKGGKDKTKQRDPKSPETHNPTDTRQRPEEDQRHETKRRGEGAPNSSSSRRREHPRAHIIDPERTEDKGSEHLRCAIAVVLICGQTKLTIPKTLAGMGIALRLASGHGKRAVAQQGHFGSASETLARPTRRLAGRHGYAPLLIMKTGRVVEKSTFSISSFTSSRRVPPPYLRRAFSRRAMQMRWHWASIAGRVVARRIWPSRFHVHVFQAKFNEALSWRAKYIRPGRRAG